ncbi:hypothetical protein ACLOJK_010874 [Asimina triloba]
MQASSNNLKAAKSTTIVKKTQKKMRAAEFKAETTPELASQGGRHPQASRCRWKIPSQRVGGREDWASGRLWWKIPLSIEISVCRRKERENLGFVERRWIGERKRREGKECEEDGNGASSIFIAWEFLLASLRICFSFYVRVSDSVGIIAIVVGTTKLNDVLADVGPSLEKM